MGIGCSTSKCVSRTPMLGATGVYAAARANDSETVWSAIASGMAMDVPDEVRS